MLPNSPGRSSESLQAEYLAKFPNRRVAEVEVPKPTAPEPLSLLPSEAPQFASTLTEAEQIDVNKVIETGRVPLAALPLDDIMQVAKLHNVRIPIDATRESLILALRNVGVKDAVV